MTMTSGPEKPIIRRKNVLFDSAPDSEVFDDREPQLSPLADYVIDVQPSRLEAIRNGIAEYDYTDLMAEHSLILEEVAPIINVNEDPEVAKVIQLDLAFMLGAYLPLKDKAAMTVPPQLLELLRMQADKFGMNAFMDYSLLIDANTREFERTGRTRTYLNGDLALSERDFYHGHHESEPFVKSAADALKKIIENPQSGETSTQLHVALENLKEFRSYMAKYVKLSKDSFSTFRPYLATYPDGTKNASGAFMPSVALAELTLHEPTVEQEVYLDSSLQYFPDWSRDVIQEWRAEAKNGRNLNDMIRSGEIKLSLNDFETLLAVVHEFVLFRTTHIAATKRQIPEAFAGKVDISKPPVLRNFGEPSILEQGETGTAGFDVVNILGGATGRLIRLKDELDLLSHTYKR